LSACSSRNSGDIDPSLYEVPAPVRSLSASSGYRTSIGDTLDIFVLEDSSFNGKYTIRPSGDIIIPKLGRIAVVSMSLAEAEGAVKRALEGSQLKKATVIADPVLRGADTGETLLNGLTVYMSGSVAKSGRKFVPYVAGNNVTALQAVMDSGGFANFANKKKAFVLRRDGTGATHRLPLDFSKIESGEMPDVPLQDGDMLVVPQKSFGL
jgi:protein involved in polysaccharide export with SLBB domain